MNSFCSDSVPSRSRVSALILSLSALLITATSASAQSVSLYSTNFGTSPTTTTNYDVATAAGWSGFTYNGTAATDVTGIAGNANPTGAVRVSTAGTGVGLDLTLVSTASSNATAGAVDQFAFTSVTSFNLQDYSDLTLAWKGSSSAAGPNFSAALRINGSWFLTSSQPHAIASLSVFLADKGSSATYDKSVAITPATSLFAFDPTVGTGSISSTATTFSSGNVSAIGFAFITTGNTGRIDDVQLTATAIPEPSSFAAIGGLGMMGFALCRRLRRQKIVPLLEE
jgi:hypothetical protein